jgi:hypothetical protein
MGWAAVCGAAHPSGVFCPRKLLGHLRYHVRLERPQEPWVMMCEVLFGRREELLPVAACELRPALAVGNLAWLIVDDGHTCSMLRPFRLVNPGPNT